MEGELAVDQSASMEAPVPSFAATLADAARRVGQLPETRIALPFAAFVSIVSVLIGVPILLPSPSSFSFVGFHYLIPIATIVGASLIFFRKCAGYVNAGLFRFGFQASFQPLTIQAAQI